MVQKRTHGEICRNDVGVDLMAKRLWRQLWIHLTCWDFCPFVFRHKEIRIVQEFGRARKLRCDRCGKYFAMSDEFQAVLPWDKELEELYGSILGFGRTNR